MTPPNEHLAKAECHLGKGARNGRWPPRDVVTQTLHRHPAVIFSPYPLSVTGVDLPGRIMGVGHHRAHEMATFRKARRETSRIGRDSRSLRGKVQPEHEGSQRLHVPNPTAVTMTEQRNERDAVGEIPVIDLSKAPGERAAWDQPRWKVYLWAACELLFVTNAWQISSGIRIRVLRAFGAEIGRGVIFRPRTRVKFPWKLRIGDRSWIGEGVWFHNQDHIHVGHDVVISQETLLTTGSHAHRRDMALLTRPIHIEAGAWITSRCIVLGGAHIGRNALIRPLSVVEARAVPADEVWGGNPMAFVGPRSLDARNPA